VDQVLLYSFLPIIFSEMEKEGKSKRKLKKNYLYQICVFGADRKSNMAARSHNVF
jgi:hypothetical protein